MRCPRCGNDNPETMRFCGMCGGTLLSVTPAARPERGASPSPQPSATATATRPVVPEHPRPPADSSPSISGPSFLGLNDPPPARKRSNLSIDPHPGARNLNYLLDDEEEHRGGGGAGKFFLIVLALLLAVGFGYLRWKNQLPWQNTGANKPTPTAQTPDQPPADSSAPASPSVTPEAQPAPNPASNSPSANTSPGTQPGGNAPASTPAAATPALPPADSSTPKADSSNPPENAATAKEQPDGAAPGKPAEPAAKADDSGDSESEAAAPAAAPKAKSTPPAKPKAASKPVDSVAEAQRYLYGRGAAQDCDHGLRILKPLANGGNSKAMVEMGALYSAGLCAPHDLPTAYRWFAVALRKDPSNEAIQSDLQKLWGEMTQPERQLAIKLTQ